MVVVSLSVLLPRHSAQSNFPETHQRAPQFVCPPTFIMLPISMGVGHQILGRDCKRSANLLSIFPIVLSENLRD